MKDFVLYGIAGADSGYRVLQHDFYDGAIYDTTPIKTQAGIMRMDNPAIEYVYLVNAGPEIAADYRRTIKRNSVEDNVIFKLTLEQKGFIIP